VTIRKGEPWGELVASPAGLFVAADDAGAGRFVRDALATGTEVPPFGVAGGDLARTMGGGVPGRFPGDVTRAAVDLLRVEADGRETVAVAHVVAGTWWRGDCRIALNAQYLGPLDLAPRSHPNDGRLDALVLAPEMSWRARFQARRRARSGTHLPHPQLSMTQTAAVSWTFDRALPVTVDGERWGSATTVTVTVLPDALVVHA
jgi:hypothetical protein